MKALVRQAVGDDGVGRRIFEQGDAELVERPLRQFRGRAAGDALIRVAQPFADADADLTKSGSGEPLAEGGHAALAADEDEYGFVPAHVRDDIVHPAVEADGHNGLIADAEAGAEITERA